MRGNKGPEVSIIHDNVYTLKKKAIHMTGGYVKWQDDPDPRTMLPHRPGGSKNTYTFPKGEWVWVEDETDWKFYDWKEKRDPCWKAKRRLGKGDGKSFEDKRKARPTVDKNDPYFEDANKLKEVVANYIEAEEQVRRYFGSTLPDELKKAKGLLKKGGDQ